MTATPTNLTDPAENTHAAPPGSDGGDGDSADVLTVFETLESAFWWVAVGTLPLTIHPRGFADLPDRPATLYQLRVRLSSATVSAESRAAIWSYIVRNARTPGPQQPDWTIAAAGLALPELMRIVASLARDQQGPGCDVADLEAAALGAFYHELRRIDLDNTRDPRLRRRLLTAAYRGARTLRDTTTHTPTRKPATGERADTRAAKSDENATTRAGAHQYPPSAGRAVVRARGQAQRARLARQRAGHTRGGQVRP
jgi:hypothetical protein